MDKGTKGTEIVTLSEYAIAKAGNDTVSTLLTNNLSGSQLQVSDLPRIKIPAGGSTTWLVPPDDAPVKDLEGIVVYQHDLRAMFAQQENGGISNDPPLCTSDDAKVGRGVPGGDCSHCANAMYGSAGAGKKGQACKSMHRIYLLAQSSVLPLVLTLSPSSLAAWRRYMIALVNGRHVVSSVVTCISLEKVTGGVAPYARIVPSMVRVLDESEQKFVDEYAAGLVPVLRAAPYATPDDEQLEVAA
jgi:hypothetical protein